jgi:hypothetical protein
MKIDPVWIARKKKKLKCNADIHLAGAACGEQQIKWYHEVEDEVIYTFT